MSTICSDLTLKARLLKKIVKGESPDDCWNWVGATYPFGYGCIGTSRGLDGAHRVSYRLHKGEIPKGMCVLHKCDNPRCSNPEHLFLGSKKDNAVDRHAKGRGKNPVHRGSRHPSAKITEEDAKAIREAATETIASLSRRFGLSETQISRIRNNERWAT